MKKNIGVCTASPESAKKLLTNLTSAQTSKVCFRVLGLQFKSFLSPGNLTEHKTQSFPTCISPQSYYWAGFQSKPTRTIWSLIGPPSPSRVLEDGDRDCLADPLSARQITEMILRPGPPSIWTDFVTILEQMSVNKSLNVCEVRAVDLKFFTE